MTLLAQIAENFVLLGRQIITTADYQPLLGAHNAESGFLPNRTLEPCRREYLRRRPQYPPKIIQPDLRLRFGQMNGHNKSQWSVRTSAKNRHRFATDHIIQQRLEQRGSGVGVGRVELFAQRIRQHVCGLAHDLLTKTGCGGQQTNVLKLGCIGIQYHLIAAGKVEAGDNRIGLRRCRDQQRHKNSKPQQQ